MKVILGHSNTIPYSGTAFGLRRVQCILAGRKNTRHHRSARKIYQERPRTPILIYGVMDNLISLTNIIYLKQ